MTQSDMQEMDVDSDDCGVEPKTLTMLIQQYKDMDLNADINDNFGESEYNPDAKQFLSKEMLNLKDTKPFIQLYEKVQDLDEICTNIDLILMIALLYSGSKQHLKMEEIYKGIILYGNQKLDQKSYIRISMFFKIITMISTVLNIKNNDFGDEYISVVESDLINALKVGNYLLVDAEIINNDNDLILAMHDLVSGALTNTRLKSSEIFSIGEEFFINLSWNPSKGFEDISFSLATVLFKVTDCLYHKDIVNYFMQMLMSFLLSKENPSEDIQKLKKIIPTKIGAIISIFLCSSDSKTLAPGLELVISSILSAKDNNMKIWNLFSVVSRIWIIKINDPQKELMMNVYDCLNLGISMYDKNGKGTKEEKPKQVQWAIIILKTIEFLINLGIMNNYDEGESDRSKLYRLSDLNSILSNINDILIKRMIDNKEKTPTTLLSTILNILDMTIVNNPIGITFQLFTRMLLISTLNTEKESSFGCQLFKSISYYPKLQHNESIDQSKYEMVFGKVVKMAKEISKCKDIISFVKMIGYLKTLKMGIDDPTFKLNLDDPFAESGLNDLLTEGFINQSTINIRNYYEGTIEKAAHAIMKQDLINNGKVDPSTFIPDHFKNIDKKYGLKEILRKCIEFNIKNNGSFKSKSQTEMIEIKEDGLFLLYSETMSKLKSGGEIDQQSMLETIRNYFEQKTS